MSNKVKAGLVYTGVALLWVGAFGLSAYVGSKVGEGVGKVCSKVTDKMLAAL